MQLSVAIRNNMGDVYESTIGASPLLRFYSGSMPADCATARSGTLLGVGALPADWLTNASNGVKSKNGTWTVTGQAAAGAGTNIGYYSIMDSSGATCHDQGSVTVTGGGGDMTVDNISIANAQVMTVNSFTRTMPNE
jgi:hypothetical protein